MKKFITLFVAITLIFSVSAWAGEIKCVKANTIIRSEVMAKDNVGIAKVGQTFKVLDTEGAWHFIKITAGSDHVGKEGWVWRKMVDGSKIIGDPSVPNPGVVLHVKPSTASAAVCQVKAGASYTLIKKQVKWYKIPKGWVYYYNFILLE